MEDLRFRARNLTQEYESIIAESPEDLMPYLLYGKFLNRIGQQEHAVRMFLKADEIDRGVAVVKQQIGNYLAEMGKFEEALGFFIQAILLSPETALYHYQMAELLSVYKESFIEERVYFRDVLEYEMMKSFSQAVQLDPKNQDFKMRYAESIYDLEKTRLGTGLEFVGGIAGIGQDFFDEGSGQPSSGQSHLQAGSHRGGQVSGRGRHRSGINQQPRRAFG